MEKNPFKEYLKSTEKSKTYKSYLWSTAIGLQAVDGLKPSQYLIDLAIKNIEDKISLKDVLELIQRYYEDKPHYLFDENRTEEADKVSVRIVKILLETSFSFTPNNYISIHKKLFQGIYKFAGKIRDYNITKKEWVLDGDTVLYGNASELVRTLEYDFSEEKNFNYKGLSMDEIIKHLALFVSRLWQIHIFGEGNTRTKTVFFIQYLKKIGFYVTNDIFAENAWYFRNSLVRANYTNIQKGIYETTEYLELFLRNLLLNEKNELHNQNLHIYKLYESKKVDIESKKVDIEVIIQEKLNCFSNKSIMHIYKIFKEFDFNAFGRNDIVKLLEIQNSSASKFIKKLVDNKIIEPISGYGKGKYRFFK